MRRRPRLTSAVGFGAAGAAVAAAWFLPSVLRNRDGVALVLYVVAPGVAAALAGVLAGTAFVDPARTGSPGRATLRGAAVASLALVIFAPMYALLFTWTAPGRASVVGLTFLVLTFSAVALWWFVRPGTFSPQPQ